MYDCHDINSYFRLDLQRMMTPSLLAVYAERRATRLLKKGPVILNTGL